MKPQFIIEYRLTGASTAYPVRLVKRAAPTFSLCPVSEASRFDSSAEADQAAIQHGIRPGNFVVKPETEISEPQGFTNLTCPKCRRVHAPFCP